MPEKNYTASYANWIYKYRWYVLILSLAAVISVGQAASRLVFDSSYRMWFDKHDPNLKAYDAFENTFGSDDAILIAFKDKNGIFTNKALESIKRITDELWKTTRVVKVDSLTNFQWTHGEDDDLLVEDLVPDLPLSEKVLAYKKAIALKEKRINGLLLSKDATTSQIVAKLQVETNPASTHYMQVRRAVEKIIRDEHVLTGYDYYIQGGPIVDTSFKIYSEQDMKTMIPILFCLVTVILVILFRSAGGTVLPMLVVGFSIMLTMGISGFAGIKLNPLTASVPQIILAVGIADAIHIVTVFLRQLKQGAERKNALIYSIEKNLKPCFLTSFTTSIGFLSLLVSKMGPLRYLGLMAGMGTIAAFIITFSFLPSALAILPFAERLTAPESKGGDWTDKIASFVIACPKRIIVFFFISAITILSFLTNVHINNNPILYFKEGTMLRDATAFIEKNLTGTESLEFVVDSGEADGIKNPIFLKKLERLQNYLDSLPQVAKTASIVDIIKRLNSSMHGEDEAYYKIPENQALSAQYLFLYTLSLPLGKDINDTINVDNSKTRMTALTWNQSSSENLKLIEKVNVWIEKNIPHVKVYTVGKTVLFSYMQIELTRSFVKSILLALFLVTLTMMFTFKSFKVGLLSMVPNVIPLMLTAGVMGIFRMHMDAGSVMVGCVAIGIAVDDTIHFLSKFQDSVEKGMDRVSAVRYVYRETATAIIFTSIVLVMGFGVFMFSQFNLNVYFGILTAIVLFFAVLCDLLLLPAILLCRES